MSNAATSASLKIDGPIATITLSSPTGVNILAPALIESLGEIVGKLQRERGLRVVALRGEGKTFAAGADIAQMSTFDEAQARRYSENGHRVFDAIEALPQVTIAGINGHALGGGCELALAFDVRIAVATAKLGQPESRLGLIPGWGGTIRLPKVVGLPTARRLMFTGDALSAEDAARIGLVDEVVPVATDLDAAIAKWAERLKPASPAAIARIKLALRSGDEKEQFAASFGCPDGKEGMAAFLGKRAANWG